MGSIETVVAVVVGTWIVCGLVNWLLFLWFTRRFVTREEYEARHEEMARKIEDQRHRENLAVQSKMLKDLEAIRRDANIPAPRGLREHPTGRPPDSGPRED